MRLLFGLLLGILMGFCWEASAQDPLYIPINASKGVSNILYDVYQSSDGFMWFASPKSLLRFDGMQVKTYGNVALKMQQGSIIQEDKYGRIWYITFDGYPCYVENDSLHTLKPSFENERPLGFNYGLTDKHLFWANNGGVQIYNLQTLQLEKQVKIEQQWGWGKAIGEDFYLAQEGKIIIVHPNGTIENKATTANNQLSKYIKTDKGNFTTDINKNKFKVIQISDDFEFLRDIPIPPQTFINHLSATDSFLWISTTSGAYMYDILNSKMKKLFFNGLNISNVIKDNEGNYWFTTLGNGALLVSDLDVLTYNDLPFVPSRLLADGDKLLIGTNKEALYSLNPQTQQYTLQFKGKQNTDVLFIKKIKESIAVGSLNLYQLDKSFRVKYELNGMSFKDMVALDEKYMVVATASNVYIYNPSGNLNIHSRWDSLAMANPTQFLNVFALLPYRPLYLVYDSLRHNLYASTNKGLYKINTKTKEEILWNNKRVLTNRMFRYNESLYAYMLKENAMLKYDLAIGKMEQISLHNMNLSGPVQFIKAVDNLLIVGVTGDFFMIDLNGKTEQAIYKGKPVKVFHDVQRLFMSNLTEDITDIALIQNQIAFATGKSLIYRPTNVKKQFTQPVLFLHKLQIGNDTFDVQNKIDVPYHQNSVYIRYAIFSYINQGKYPLYYRINDGPWVLTDINSHQLSFPSLAPGKYEIWFRLGLASQHLQISRIQFEIHKAFWQSTLFWFVVFSLFSMAIIVYFHQRTQTTKRENQLKIERIALENDLRSSTLTSIRAQMNPHFFYNALNTIQAFIFSNEKKQAAIYLSKFAKMTRMILEMSDKEEVSLQEEVEAMELYLSLEKARFEESFDYDIEVDPNVDAEMIKIPSMIVQPFVENALKHGLLHREGEKKLKIHIKRAEKCLLMMIDDNGIGRKRSEEINQLKRDKPTSFATSAIQRRIALLNQSSPKVEVSYHDKFNEWKRAEGTLVTIKIWI